MFPLATPQNPALPFTDLPDQALRAARDSIEQRGFAPRAILENYSYSGQDGYVKVNAVAFADEQRRTPAEYAGFSVYNAANGVGDETIVTILAQTAAPFHLIHRGEKFSFWASTVDASKVIPVHLKSNIAYSQLNQVFRDFANDLTPKRIVDVKQGRDHFTHPFLQQLAPVQLALWAIDATSKLLVTHFGQAVSTLREHAPNTTIETELTRLAVQLLGAIILADTGVLGNEIRRQELDLQLSHLLQAASSEFPSYFQRTVPARLQHAAEAAYTVLRQIRFASFVPEMLSKLYTAAYDKAARKELGRYDTPLYLTRRIWQNMPLEFLPPEQRVTVDMTCGWGSFLVAGCERLGQISDMRGLALRNYVRGNDIDAFTADLARLGLLLATSQDSWQIDHQDALTWNWLDTNQPGIIVGNPPFGGRRDQPKTLDKLMSEEGRTRVEAANAYMQRAVRHLAPGGLLAMVLPRSFLASEAGPEVRRELLEQCDITDIWQLPGKVFRDATVQPIVLFARKHAEHRQRSFPVRMRNIQRSTLEIFKLDGTFTASNIAADQSRWNEHARMSPNSKNTHLITPSVILAEREWTMLRERCGVLASVATMFPGVIRGKKVGNKRWLNFVDSKNVCLLTDAKRVAPRTRPWYVNYNGALALKYPNDFEKPRLEHRQALFEPKALLVAAANPSWGRRSKAVIERKGYCVSHSFWVIAPLEEDEFFITHEVIAAVLNWYVSNAWIADNLSYPWIERRILDTIPFPCNLTEEQCTAITAAVKQLEAAAAENLALPVEAQHIIDIILTEAYQLDEATLTRLRAIAEWDEHPLITLDPQPDRSQADYMISGVVDSVQAEQGTITLWISGFDELQTVPIDSLMPGWMLRSDVAFRAKIPYECERQRSLEGVVWGNIEPQQHTYLDEQELIDELAHIFDSDGTNQYDTTAHR